MRANLYFAMSLSETPIRVCRRFFVSANFSCWEEFDSDTCYSTADKTHGFHNEAERYTVCPRHLLLEVEDTYYLLVFIGFQFFLWYFLHMVGFITWRRVNASIHTSA